MKIITFLGKEEFYLKLVLVSSKLRGDSVITDYKRKLIFIIFKPYVVWPQNGKHETRVILVFKYLSFVCRI